MQFLRMMRVSLMEFGFIGLESVVFQQYTYNDQPVQNLQNLGFDYISGSVNIFENICFLFMILVLHSACYIVFEKVYIAKNKLNIWQKSIKFIGKWMCINMYVRYFALSYVLYLVSFISEMNYNKFGYRGEWSVYASLIFILLLGLFISIPIWIWYVKIMKKKSIFKDIFKELFKFTRKGILPRLYPFISFIRKLILCLLVCVNFGASQQLILGFFVAFEGLHLLFIISVRPYRIIKDNFYAIFNALLMIFYSVSCFFYNNMNNAFTWTYLWIIMANMLVILITAIISLTYGIMKNMIKVELRIGDKKLNLNEESKIEDKSNVNLKHVTFNVKQSKLRENDEDPLYKPKTVKKERLIKRPAELFPEDVKVDPFYNNEHIMKRVELNDHNVFIKNPSTVHTQRPRPKSPVSLSLTKLTQLKTPKIDYHKRSNSGRYTFLN